MLRVGLTGGIASGKSAVAAMFVELGAALVDTDVIARELVAPGSPALRSVREAFGADVFHADGALDRRALRALVFYNDEERRKLEAILHPLIRARAAREMDESDGPYVIVAVPLLVENRFTELVDRVAVVHCTLAQQIDRVMRRDRVSREDAEAVIAAQADEETRLKAADDVIDNTGSLEQTRLQVAELHDRYSKLANDCRAAKGSAE